MVVYIDTENAEAVASKKGIAGCRWYDGVSSWQSSSRLCSSRRVQGMHVFQQVTITEALWENGRVGHYTTCASQLDER